MALACHPDHGDRAYYTAAGPGEIARRQQLLDAAKHFISRDRTQTTQDGLATRLIQARLLQTSTPASQLPKAASVRP